jgi:Spy/CpxP family protein refolding chaperone
MRRLLGTPYRPLVMQLRGVKLTPEQRQQVAAVLKAHQPELKAQAAKARGVRQGWQQAGKIDIQERKTLMEQRMALMQPVRTEILNLLTPEQRAQLEARRFKRQR